MDDFTDKGVKDGRITHGSRATTSDADGGFVLEHVPRTSAIQIDASGYLRVKAPSTVDEIRLSPLSVTIHVSEEGGPDGSD